MKLIRRPKAFAWRAVWEKLYGSMDPDFLDEQYRLWMKGVRDGRIHDNWFTVATILGYSYG